MFHHGYWYAPLMSYRYLLFVTLTFLLTGLIGYSTFRTARLLKSWQPDVNILLLPTENMIRLILILVCIGLGALSDLPDERLGWSGEEMGRQIFWGIGWGIVLAGTFATATAWLRDVGGKQFYSDIVLEHILPKDGVELIQVSLVMISVVMLEELLFRSLKATFPFGGTTPVSNRH